MKGNVHPQWTGDDRTRRFLTLGYSLFQKCAGNGALPGDKNRDNPSSSPRQRAAMAEPTPPPKPEAPATDDEKLAIINRYSVFVFDLVRAEEELEAHLRFDQRRLSTESQRRRLLSAPIPMP